MSYTLNGSSNDDRVETAKRQHQQRLTRFFVAFAVIEGLAMVAAVVAIYLLGLIDPDQGVWILVVIAGIGGLVMGASMLSMTRRHVREMHDLTGY